MMPMNIKKSQKRRKQVCQLDLAEIIDRGESRAWSRTWGGDGWQVNDEQSGHARFPEGLLNHEFWFYSEVVHYLTIPC